jgi:mannosyl-3-phosphoglycerate phosphatase
MSYIVFTDLDGTLLDHGTYDYKAALPGLKLLKKAGIPVVFCSSKTRREQEVLRGALGVSDPFIVEDGSAVFIEKGYFKTPPGQAKVKDGYHVLELGTPYERVREGIATAARELGTSLRGFGDATREEVAEATGLSSDAAALAKEREYEETLLTPLSATEATRLKEILTPLGLTLSRGGRFHSVKGQCNKGQAAMALARLLARETPRLVTVGIGDSANDQPMLLAMYIPVLVQRPDKTWQKMRLAGVKKVEGVGPVGWTRAVERLLAGRL